MKRALLTILILAWATPAPGQEIGRLTSAEVEAAEAFYNAPGTIRLSGDARVAPGTEIVGDVAVLGASLRVEGVVRGDLLVINGDLVVEPAGRITGSARVIGGGLRGDPGTVAGGVVVYPEALDVRRVGDRVALVLPGRPGPVGARLPTGFGSAEFNAGIEGSYNRVEGLPVRFGPRVELGRSNPTVLDARLIYRTLGGLRVHPDELGHEVRLEQYLGGHRAIRLGVGIHRTVEAIDDRGMTDTENSLSTFLLHRDYRDHYAQHGWTAGFRWGPRSMPPLSVDLEYRDESFNSVRPESPWSLLDNDDPWRPQPQAAEGELRSMVARVQWDGRNDPVDPSAGWLIRFEAEQGLEGDLTVRRLAEGGSLPWVREPVESEYTRVSLDLRRYLRLGPRTRLALRGLVEGSPDDGALPPQRQIALGGEGSLPGYSRFSLDCEARDQDLVDGYFPYYGCDRALLLQGELRFSLLGAADLSLGRRLGLDFDLLSSPELVVFADAGRAWIEAESLGSRGGVGPRSLRYDAGVGVRTGRLGLYLAVPFSDGDEGVNVFIRLGPRL